jgi:hypothetical protein
MPPHVERQGHPNTMMPTILALQVLSAAERYNARLVPRRSAGPGENEQHTKKATRA